MNQKQFQSIAATFTFICKCYVEYKLRKGEMSKHNIPRFYSNCSHRISWSGMKLFPPKVPKVPPLLHPWSPPLEWMALWKSWMGCLPTHTSSGRGLYSTLFQEKPPERKLIFWADFIENWVFPMGDVKYYFVDLVRKWGRGGYLSKNEYFCKTP